MPDEVTLVAAKATVHDGVTLENGAQPTVDLEAGDTLRVRFPYRIHDQPKPEELWTFRLTTRLDGEDEAVSERIHRDRKLVSDHEISHVGVDLHFPKPGEFSLSYEAFAQLAHRDWDDKSAFKPVSDGVCQGDVTVRVS